MSSKNRSIIPRKLKIIPVAIASAFLFIILSLLGLLNFNLPSFSNSSGDPQESSSNEETFISTDSNEVPEPKRDEIDDANRQPLDLVDVLINGDDYWVATATVDGELDRHKKTVEEVVSDCTKSVGDSSGIKVRISRTFEATAQAERQLIDALEIAGLSEDQIDQRRTLVNPTN